MAEPEKAAPKDASGAAKKGLPWEMPFFILIVCICLGAGISILAGLVYSVKVEIAFLLELFLKGAVFGGIVGLMISAFRANNARSNN